MKSQIEETKKLLKYIDENIGKVRFPDGWIESVINEAKTLGLIEHLPTCGNLVDDSMIKYGGE